MRQPKTRGLGERYASWSRGLARGDGRRMRAVLAALTLACLLTPSLASAEDVLLWHAYRGREASALEEVVDHFREAHPGTSVRVLAVPHEAYTNKLASAIPRGNGPDVFIGAHDQTGGWSQMKLIETLDDDVTADQLSAFHPLTVEALRFEGALYGLPLAFKSPVLIVNRALVPKPPKTTDELFALLETLTDHEAQRYGLVYEVSTIYYHSAWLHGFGGHVFADTGSVDLANDGAAASFEFAKRIAAYLPHEVDGARVKRLFNDGQAAMVIDGPWFLPQIDPAISYAIAPLPLISETGTYAAPFVTAEGIFISSEARDRASSLELARYIATEGAVGRAREGGQMVAYLPAYDDPSLAGDAQVEAERAVFLAQLDHTVPMSNRPEMSSLWGPLEQALRKAIYGAPSGATPYWLLIALMLFVFGVWGVARGRDQARTSATARPWLVGAGLVCLASVIPAVWKLLDIHGASGEMSPMDALREAQSRYLLVQAPTAQEANPAPYVAVAALLCLAACGIAVVAYRKHRARQLDYPDTKAAVAYVAPAVLAMLLLVVTPFVLGTLLSFFAYQRGEFIFVGLQNFARLFAGEGTPYTDSLSFYFTLVVTVLWTAINVFLHVAIGLGLALLLRDPWLRMRGVYRVLLIIPWAVPNYITALIWRGMFDTEFGAVNGILSAIGLTPVNWFDAFLTSFAANVTTNTWLGFPFMMVVTLGALQSIPRDLEDAAAVDGANRWQRFKEITMPLLRPALIPAVILGSVWTFNMFNIIYLVSRGNPDSSTEILISEAYKWAFERQFQYGYAAAYATVVFVLLVVYTRVTRALLETEA